MITNIQAQKKKSAFPGMYHDLVSAVAADQGNTMLLLLLLNQSNSPLL